MTGIRIKGVPKLVTEKHLKIHFSKPENNGGKIQKIYFPLFNNDAVILFERLKDFDGLMGRRHEIRNYGAVEIERLPEHMIFTSMEAKLDQNASVMLQATPSLRDEMEFSENIKITIEGDQQTCHLHGNWFQLEWAWHYIDCFMQQQEIIQSEIAQQPLLGSTQSADATAMEVDDSEDDTRQGTRYQSKSPTEVNTSYRKTKALQHSDIDKYMRASQRDEGTDSRYQTALDRREPAGRHTDTYSRLGFDQYENEKSDFSHGEDKDTSYPESVGGPNMGTLKANTEKSYQTPVTSSYSIGSKYGASGRGHVTLEDSDDDDLDLQGNGHKVPFESVHSTLNMENKIRRTDENTTFEQFSGMDLNHRSSPQISPSSSLRIDIPGNDKKSYRDKKSDQSSTSGLQSRSFRESGEGSSSSSGSRRSSPSEGHASMSRSKHGAASTTVDMNKPITSASSSSRSLPRTPTSRLLQSYSKDQLLEEFDVRGVKVIVYCGDITKETTDAIVNAANEQLDHMGGLAYAISKVRGPEMQIESNDYIRKNGSLKTTEVMSTSGGGDIKATHIIHAAGPMWLEFNKQKIPAQLIQTYLNCFNYANEKLWITSLAVPAISTGVYGAPLDVCVRSFLDAVLIFTHNRHTLPRLREIKMVNRDAECTVTSIVLIQTLLETELDTMTRDALISMKTISESSARGLNLPRGRQEKTDFSKTLKGDKSYTSESALISSGAKWKSSRRSSSLSRASDRKAASYGEEGVSRFDPVSQKFDQKSATYKHDDDRKTDTRHKDDIRGRARTNSLSLRDKSDNKNTTVTDTTRESKHRSAFGGTLEASRTSKRPSTAEGIGKSAPPIKQSLMAQTDNKKPFMSMSKTSSSSKYAREPDTTNISPRWIKSYSKREQDEARNGGRMEADYEFGLQSLPANLDSPTYREKFLQFNQRDKDKDEKCAICLDTVKRPKVLTKCKHKFCAACIDEHFYKSKPTCPTCGTLYGLIRGDQPKSGTMKYSTKHDIILPGYEDADGAIVVEYYFPGGIQESCHPNPGRAYKSLSRKAFLPNSIEGREVLRLLKKAFDVQLVFTIGDSRTSGKLGVLTWNDIHHKTNIQGGPTKYGYPDPSYLRRVKEELAMKGITSGTI